METWWCWSGSLLCFAEPHSVKFSVFAETRVEFVSFSFALLDISVFYCLLITFSSPISSPELFCCCWMFSVLSEPTNHQLHRIRSAFVSLQGAEFTGPSPFLCFLSENPTCIIKYVYIPPAFVPCRTKHEHWALFLCLRESLSRAAGHKDRSETGAHIFLKRPEIFTQNYFVWLRLHLSAWL